MKLDGEWISRMAAAQVAEEDGREQLMDDDKFQVTAEADLHYSRDEWVRVAVPVETPLGTRELAATVRAQLSSSRPIDRPVPVLGIESGGIGFGLSRSQWETFKKLADRAFAEWDEKHAPHARDFPEKETCRLGGSHEWRTRADYPGDEQCTKCKLARTKGTP